MIDKIIKNLLLERNAEQVTYNTDEAIKEHKEQCDFLIELLEKQKTNGWIPCSERLPETYDNLLICQSDGYVNVGYCSLNEFRDMNSYLYKDVIAWQPLPEPYKEEGV